MTTQATQATVGNGTFSKIFNLTATDGTWNGNSLTDSLSSSPLGILIPGAVINHVCVTYAGGACAWRIQNAQTLQVSRRGLCSVTGTVDYQDCSITPYSINPNDILVVYPVALEATPAQSNVMAWVTTSKGTELFTADAVPDNTATAMTSAVNSQSIGDAMFNSVLASVRVQAEDGATVSQVDVIDSSGGTVYTVYGSVRGSVVGASSLYMNLDASGLGIQIGKGFILKVTTVSA